MLICTCDPKCPMHHPMETFVPTEKWEDQLKRLFGPTDDEIRAYAKEHSVGLLTAKEHLTKGRCGCGR